MRALSAILGLAVLGSARAEDPPAPDLGEMLAKAIPHVRANTGAAWGTMQPVVDEVLRRGPEGMAELLAMVEAEDAAFRFRPIFALNSLNVRLQSPDLAARRPEFVRAVASALDTMESASVRLMLIEQLQQLRHPDAVPALAAKLADEDLGVAAAMALAGIGTPEAHTRMRAALPGTTGRARQTLLRHLGEAGDRGTLAAATSALRDSDRDTRIVAAHALAGIGDPASAGALRQALEGADPVERVEFMAAGLGLSRRLADLGRDREALGILLHAWSASTPVDRGVRGEVLHTLARVKAPEAEEILVAAFSSPDWQHAARAVLEARPQEAADWYARIGEEDRGKREAFLRLVSANPAPDSLPLVRVALADSDPKVVEAGAGLASQIGSPESLDLLIGVLGGGSPHAGQVVQAMRQAPPALAGRLAAAYPGMAPEARIQALEILAARRDRDQMPLILEALRDDHEGVRRQAAQALGAVGGAEQAPLVVGWLKGNDPAMPWREALPALEGLIGRRDDPNALASLLASSLRELAEEAQPEVIRLVGRQLRQPATLDLLRREIGSPAPANRDAAIRALADWPSPDALPHLATVLQDTDTQPAHRILTVRGAIRLNRDASRSERDRLDGLAALRPHVTRHDETRQLLGALGELPLPGALAAARDYLDDGPVAEDAGGAVVRIAEGLIKAGRKDGLAPALARVIEVCRNERTVEAATRLAGQLDEVLLTPGEGMPKLGDSI